MTPPTDSPLARSERQLRDDSALELEDGRSLQYREHGSRDDTTVLFFHGTPGSRVCIPTIDTTSNTDVHLITVDRPGYGQSTEHRDRALSDWAADISELTDTLGIDEFAVVGLSGGGPHALACGASLSSRVQSVGVISGMAPVRWGTTRGMSTFNRFGFLVARYLPALLPFVLRPMARRSQSDPTLVIDAARSRYAEPDQSLLDDATIRRCMTSELTAAYQQGVRGHVDDLVALSQDWGFDVGDIDVPVRLWHGGKDRNAPFSMAERLARHIPQSELRAYPDEGHLLVYRHFETILRSLVQTSR
ncbi:alpha/beta fold hydrolase [Halomarina oriensis]|uniref:Alpha/beta fold hydrolase n=1 Tax=Halomarina oriensis TaxID=671145 RepID=A0A6B0GIQ3_9EURY|nr:alpha/beta fold hydrolase [Halomarina oriensis]